MTSSTGINGIGQVARSVRDVAQSTAWYRDVLGLPLLYIFEGMAFFDLAGMRLYLQQQADAGEQSILYFTVEDISATHAALEARGVRFLRPPHLVHRHGDGTEDWMAFFTDLEDRPLALMSRRSRADRA
ncbi:methylmalonyl-CoA epimerase [Devosia lucknowensis]|uniref:Methylmalonyl-CoA epimerase n=1 Tax=Devosia lucknowensis TaxID=1096929 RepID=A0A1Y6G671_9HYPH|nr:VOC family protein [Devosia lucknowensis]SMQ85681.1 methylmalonyl-CoA epimerase [Devosia lucknowensis]